MNVSPTVIIVNYNAGDHLIACLAALRRQTIRHTVVVVDNNSRDGSARMAHTEYPSTRFLPLRRNVGFARAVNIGASRFGDPEGVVVTLNPDTVPQEGFLQALLEPFAGCDDLGAVSGTLVFASDPTVIASAGIDVHRNGLAIDSQLGEPWSPGTERPIFGATGGAAAYRVSALRDAGWFPDAFYLYLEDVDLAWRMRLLGWSAVSSRTAVAHHAYSASAVEGSPFKRRLLARNRLWTLARCLPADIWVRDRLSIAGFDTVAAGYAVARRDVASLRGRGEAIAGLPARLIERRTIQSRMRVAVDEIDSWIREPLPARELLRLRALTRGLSSSTRGSS